VAWLGEGSSIKRSFASLRMTDVTGVTGETAESGAGARPAPTEIREGEDAGETATAPGARGVENGSSVKGSFAALRMTGSARREWPSPLPPPAGRG